MYDDKILITNIQRFSLHDGPGIRTTVFLKGCSLRCSWCSNPENLTPFPQEYVKDGEKGIYGKWMTADDLVHECLKDKNFYEGKIDREHWKISKSEDIVKLPGGVTFSGGEALLQVEALVPVFEALHSADIHIAVETALFVPVLYLDLAIKYIDFFYVDMKILDTKKCEAIEHGNLNLYLTNLDRLFTWTDKGWKPVVIRVPVIGGYTDGTENRRAVKGLIEKYRTRILKVELIKEHNLGESKYKSLGKEIDYHGVGDGVMEEYRGELETAGIPVEICRI